MNTIRIAKLGTGVAVSTLLLLGSAGLALAQTDTTTGADAAATTDSAAVTTDAANPGVPNTGAGGDSTSTLLILTVSALAMLGGGLYLARPRTVTQ